MKKIIVLSVVMVVVLMGLGCTKKADVKIKPFYVKSIKIEGDNREKAQFIQDAIIGAFLKKGAMMSPGGVTITGRYDVENFTAQSIRSIRINVSGVNPTGLSIAAIGEIRDFPGDWPGAEKIFSCASGMAQQFHDELIVQQSYSMEETTKKQ